MPFKDMLFPKKSSTEDLLPGSKRKKKGEDLEGSVQDLYGLQAPVPVPAAKPPGPRSPGATPASNPAAATKPPPPTQAPPSGVPAPAAQADPEPLDNPLRDLFTENTAMDPQLEALLKRVDKISAKDLFTELHAFARSVGVESAQ